MESTRHPPPRRTTEPAPPATDADRRAQERAAKEQTDAEIAERVSSPPEQPTPTQEEADAYKEGEPAVPPPEGGAARAGETAAQRREREEKERHERDVKPDDHGRAGYQTRT
jgi:hypothetical protein